MPHPDRSAQVTGPGDATEPVFSTGASANSHYRRHVASEASATFRYIQSQRLARRFGVALLSFLPFVLLDIGLAGSIQSELKRKDVHVARP